LGEIIRRHEVLRTRFVVREGEPRQEVVAAGQTRLQLVELGGLEAREREEEARRMAVEEAGKPFDLSRGPLLRMVLLRLEEEQHILLCTVHHLGGDAWSLEVLSRELSHLYQSYSLGQRSQLPELGIQYGDYAVWQRKWLSGEVVEERRRYWKKRLEGAPGELKLPQKQRRGAVQSFQGARQGMELEEGLSEEVRGLSRREGVTLYMSLLTAFVVLLNQYTGERDMVVGSVIANREREEVEELIGFVANTILLRVEVEEGWSFREVLGHVRERCLEAYAEHLPPEKLVEGREGTGPLFNVWFQMEQAGREKLELNGLKWENYAVERANARFELSLILVEKDSTIAGELEYDASLFDQKYVGKMLEHFKKVVNTMVSDPNADISSVPLNSELESKELIWAFSLGLEG